MQVFHDARELWPSQGLAYFEPDKITLVDGATIRELLHVGLWRARITLKADAEVVPA